MKENSLSGFLRRSLGPRVHYVRVENSVGPGTPDVNYCIAGREGWMELKYRRTLPLDHDETPVFTDRTGLSVDQQTWIAERVAAKGSVWIVAGVGRLVFFIPGLWAREFNGEPINALADRACAIFVNGGDNDADVIRATLASPFQEAFAFRTPRVSEGIAYLRGCRVAVKRKRVSLLPPTVRLAAGSRSPRRPR